MLTHFSFTEFVSLTSLPVMGAGVVFPFILSVTAVTEFLLSQTTAKSSVAF